MIGIWLLPWTVLFLNEGEMGLAFDGSASRVDADFKKMPFFGIFPNTVRTENALQMALIRRLDFPCDFSPTFQLRNRGSASWALYKNSRFFFQPCPGAFAFPDRGLPAFGNPAHRTRRV